MGKIIKKFSGIPLNRSDIAQQELNIDDKTRSNIFCWRGQFSPQFIEVLLDKYALQNYTVIDPFVGSGTTLVECARKNISAIGTELNVSAYYLAKTYECTNLTDVERVKLLSKINDIVCSLKQDSIIDQLICAIHDSDDYWTVNVLSTLIIVLDIYNNIITLDYLREKWGWLRRVIEELPYSKSPIRAHRGDARNMNLNDSSADLLITSPPYINVFNYHQKYRRSVEALGYNVLEMAKSEFGANRKNRSNRFYTVIQYCIDMSQSLREAMRVCKDKSRMIYVVGRESSVMGYAFYNSELLYNIAVGVLELELDIRQERAFRNKFGHIIYEDILHFRNNKAGLEIDPSIVTENASKIGRKMLQERLLLMPQSKNTIYLESAITNYSKVVASEVAYA